MRARDCREIVKKIANKNVSFKLDKNKKCMEMNQWRTYHYTIHILKMDKSSLKWADADCMKIVLV